MSNRNIPAIITLLNEIKDLRNYLSNYSHEQTYALPYIQKTICEQPKSTLDFLCIILNLSPYERFVLLLCLAIKLDPNFAKLYAAIQGNENYAYPNLNLEIDLSTVISK